MRYYEKRSTDYFYLTPGLPYIITLKCKNIKGIIKNYCEASGKNDFYPGEFHRAFILTANDLLNKYLCNTIYLCNDQFIMVYSASNISNSYNKKISDLLYEIAVFASCSMIHNTANEITHTVSSSPSENTSIASDTNNIHDFFACIQNPNNYNNLFMFNTKYITFGTNTHEIENYILWKQTSFQEFDLINSLAKRFISKKKSKYMSYDEIATYIKNNYSKYCSSDYIELFNGLFLKLDKLSSDKWHTNFYIPKTVRCSPNFASFLTGNGIVNNNVGSDEIYQALSKDDIAKIICDKP
jgi:hypothetical protein